MFRRLIPMLALAQAAAAAGGCARMPSVDRVYDGRVVAGRYVEPEAYAAFLQGAIAEASGRLDDAILAYDKAAALDARSPEIVTRVGALYCQRDPRDSRADRAFARAIELDPSCAHTWAARARCDLARGDERAAQAAALRARALDPMLDLVHVVGAITMAGAADHATREALVALTVSAPDPVAAWSALVAWARAHGDVALWVRALEQYVRWAPGERGRVARAAEDLAGLGAAREARAVAAAAADAPDENPLSPAYALAARLALDRAIATGDVRVVRRRASRLRIGLDEAGARAWLAGRPALARTLVEDQAAADPTSRGARLVLAACGDRDIAAAGRDARKGDVPVPDAVLVAFGVALVRAATPNDARAILRAIAHDEGVPGDALVARPAVALVARGALDPGALTLDGAVELAALRGQAVVQRPGLDACHEYLALALSQPRAPQTRELGARLARVGAADPRVVAATALVELSSGEPIASEAPRAVLARDPADPLLAAVALRMAERVGNVDVARRARATLAALGGASAGPAAPGGGPTDGG